MRDGKDRESGYYQKIQGDMYVLHKVELFLLMSLQCQNQIYSKIVLEYSIRYSILTNIQFVLYLQAVLTFFL